MKPVFNKAQLYLLEVFSRIKTDEELDELVRVIRDHYTRKLDGEMDKLWESGQFDQKALDRLEGEHLRTPYGLTKDERLEAVKGQGISNP